MAGEVFGNTLANAETGDIINVDKTVATTGKPTMVASSLDELLQKIYPDATSGQAIVFDGTNWGAGAVSASVSDGSITAAKLASNAVTSIKIADSAATDAKLATKVYAAKVVVTSGTPVTTEQANTTGTTATVTFDTDTIIVTFGSAVLTSKANISAGVGGIAVIDGTTGSNISSSEEITSTTVAKVRAYGANTYTAYITVTIYP